jgi:hypothetical protein
MKKHFSSIFFTLLLVATCATFAFAQSLNGDWDVWINTPGGPADCTAALKHEGENLSGRIKTPHGEAPISGALKGADVTLKFTVNVNGTELLVTLKGKLEGGELKGGADFGGVADGDWTARKAKLAFAQSLSGDWDISLNTPIGPAQSRASLKHEGENLSGRIKTMFGEFPISGTLKDKDVTLKYTISADGNSLTVTLTGKLEGETMKGSADFETAGEGDWTAKKAK